MDSRMMNKKSLVYKTLLQFFKCTAVTFILMAPLFYLLTRYFYAEDLIDVIHAVEKGKAIPNLDLERDIMTGVMLQFLLTFITLSIALFITVRFITYRLWKPFDDTLRKTENFNLSKNELPVFDDTDIIEFSLLNSTLIKMMSKNREIYLIQKEFTENASHELQTPLAVVRSKLDLLMQENLTENQSRIVAELYRLNTRMGHLNRNLLLLAKIENSQYDRLDVIIIKNYIESLIPSYNALCGNDRRVDIITGNFSGWSVKANTILFESMINNLVVNAIRHTKSGDMITIDISRIGYIEISNPADGSPLNSTSMFQRFNNIDSENRGNGLGLAIVKAICDFHGWRVWYSFTLGRHLFSIETESRGDQA